MRLAPLLLLATLVSCNSQVADLGRVTPISFFVRQFGAESAVALGQDHSDNDDCSGMVRDQDNNTYCGGHTLGSFAEASGGSADVLVVKLDANGNHLWSRQLGAATKVAGGSNAGTDRCYAIAVDPNGNTYCGGETTGSMSGTAVAGPSDAMVVKLDRNGSLTWVKQIGSSDRDFISSVTVSGGFLYVAGTTNGELDPGENLSQLSINDAFVIKATLDGDVVWKRQLGNRTLLALGRPAPVDDEAIASVLADPHGNVYVVGATLSDLMEPKGGNKDGFIWKLGADGATVAVKHFGQVTLPNSQSDKFTGAAIDGDTLYLNGTTASSLGEPVGATGRSDLFVTALDLELNVRWLTQLGARTVLPQGDNSWDEESSGIAVGKYGVYALFRTNGAVGEVSSIAFDLDLAVVRLHKRTGKLLDGFQLGSETVFPGQSNLGEDIPASISVDALNRIYVGGSTRSEMGESFGGVGSNDLFVLKLDTNYKFTRSE